MLATSKGTISAVGVIFLVLLAVIFIGTKYSPTGLSNILTGAAGTQPPPAQFCGQTVEQSIPLECCYVSPGCVAKPPGVTITPSVKIGSQNAPDALAYTVKVENNDSGCDPSNLTFRTDCPAGFTCTTPNNISQSYPGQIDTSEIVVTPQKREEGTLLVKEYPFSITVNNTASSLSNTSTAIYNLTSCVKINPSITISPASATQYAIAGDMMNYTLTVKNKALCGMTFKFTAACVSGNCDAGWASFDNATSFTLKGGETASTAVHLQSIGGSSNPSTPDQYQFNVTAEDYYESMYNDSKMVTYYLRAPPDCARNKPVITPLGWPGATGRPAGTLNYTLQINNADDCIGFFDITTDCPAGTGWNCVVNPASVSSLLATGGTADVNISITSPSMGDVAEGAYPINVTVKNSRDLTNTKSANQTFTYTVAFAPAITLTPNPYLVNSNNADVSTITAQVGDGKSGVTIMFASNLTGSSFVSGNTCTTGATGNCSVMLKSSVAGIATINATASDYLNGKTNARFTPIGTLNPTLSATPYSQYGAAGNDLDYTLTIKNNNPGATPIVFNVVVESNCNISGGGWQCGLTGSGLTNNRVTLRPLEQTQVTLTAKSDVNANTGEFSIPILVEDVDKTLNATALVIYNVTKCTYTNPALTVDKMKSGASGENLTFNVNLSNLDICSVKYDLMITPPDWTPTFPPKVFVVGKSNASFSVNITSPITAGYGMHNFTITALNGVDSEKTASGQFSYNVTKAICTGSIQLAFSPEKPAYATQAAAITSGLKYCQGKNISLRNATCSGPEIASAISQGTGANISFIAPAAPGTYSYAVCINKLNDGYADPSEHAEADVQVVICAKRNPGLSIDPISQTASLGETMAYTTTLVNQHACAAAFKIVPTCPSGWNCTVTPESVELNPGESTTVGFDVRSGGFNSGERLGVTASDAADSEYTSSATVYYNVQACQRVMPELALSKSELQSTAGSSDSTTVTIYNRDTCSSSYSITTTDCPSSWNCTATPSSLTVVAGDTGTSVVKITAPATAATGASTISVKVKNTADLSKESNATITYTIINCTDADNDHFFAEGGSCGLKDCNDTNSGINPNATEICIDNIDNNCNGKIDASSEGCGGQSGGGGGGGGGDLSPSTPGNGICEPGETQLTVPQDCGCPPGKELSGSVCIEPTPTVVCGDDTVETGEDCDGTSDINCPGLCNANCKCPFIVGDGICDSAAGEVASLSPTDCKKSGMGSIALILFAVVGALGGGFYYYKRRSGMLGGLATAHGVDTSGAGGDLGTAVNSMLSEGYSPEEIHGNLEDSGWSHNKVSSAMQSAQTDQEALGKLADKHGVSEPSEADEADALKYAKTCVSQGYDPTQIKTALVSAGWSASIVDDVISKITTKHIEDHAERAGVSKPSGNTNKLSSYVKKELQEGHTAAEIKKVLKKSGWQDSDINEAFGG